MRKILCIILSIIMIGVVASSGILSQMGAGYTIIYEDFNDQSVMDINASLGGSARFVQLYEDDYALMFFDAYNLNRIGAIEIPIDVDVTNDTLYISLRISFPNEGGIFIYIVTESIIDIINTYDYVPTNIVFYDTVIGSGYGIGFDVVNQRIKLVSSDGNNVYVDAELPHMFPIGGFIPMKISISQGRLSLSEGGNMLINAVLRDVGQSRFRYLVIGGQIRSRSSWYKCMVDDLYIVIETPQTSSITDTEITSTTTTPTVTETVTQTVVIVQNQTVTQTSTVTQTQVQTVTVGPKEWWGGLSTVSKIAIIGGGLLIILLLVAASGGGRRRS